MIARRKFPALAVALSFAALPVTSAQVVTLREMNQDLQVNVRAEVSGEVSVTVWSRNGGRELIPILPGVVGCQGKAKVDNTGGGTVRCPMALRRDGLALEEVVDLAPIARTLDPSTSIQLWLYSPRLGFDSSSIALDEEEGGGELLGQSMRFAAANAPAPIHIRFGYRPDQLAGIYLPLVGLALALTLIAFFMSRAGLAALSRSAVLLSMMVWMGTAARLQADGPVRIWFFGSSLANLLALFLAFWPPLFCVALGVALGSTLHAGQTRIGKAAEVLGALAVIPLLLTCVVGALPSLFNSEYAIAVIWLAATPIILLLRRSWIRARAQSKVRQLTTGELKERISALAARAGCPKVKAYVSFSKRSEMSNAFALPGKSIFLTAPLVRSLSKREVDAVAAHELSHIRHSGRGIWTALCLAMLLCETPVKDTLSFLPGGVLTAMLVPIIVFFASLGGMRRREFAADAGAAALTGDPQAMISSLAKIARNNRQPLDFKPLAEWLSSHPSTRKRIRALAARAGLDAAAVEKLCISDVQGESYELPGEDAERALFTPAWQTANAQIYGWVVIFASSGAGVLAAWLAGRFAGANPGGYGAFEIAAGIALGCLLTKCLASAAMAANFANLRRKLEAKLGTSGELVGLALESEPRLYNGFRFSDAGLLRFEGGRLCYQSERVNIALNPADVVDVAMVAASPSNWARRQPMVRFREPESCTRAFILHPVGWVPTQRRLLKSIERWRAAQSSPEHTSIRGFNPVAGEAFTNPTVPAMARGFLVPGTLTLLGTLLTGWMLRAEWWYVGLALTVAACSHIFLFLPALLYRSSAPPAALATPANAK